MKTGFIADIHANLPALEAILRKAESLHVDDFVFLGDIAGYGPYPVECIEKLMNMKNSVLVRGNHDYWSGLGEIEDGINSEAQKSSIWTQKQLSQNHKQWLQSLPCEHRFLHWIAIHGCLLNSTRHYGYIYEMTYKANIETAKNMGLKVVFYGHTHVPFVHRMEHDGKIKKIVPQSEETIKLFEPGNTILINPGSVGQPRNGDTRASFGVWDRVINTFTFYFVQYPLWQVTQKIKEVGLPETIASRLEVGR